jgi:hypothetical protein
MIAALAALEVLAALRTRAWEEMGSSETMHKGKLKGAPWRITRAAPATAAAPRVTQYRREMYITLPDTEDVALAVLAAPTVQAVLQMCCL